MAVGAVASVGTSILAGTSKLVGEYNVCVSAGLVLTYLFNILTTYMKLVNYDIFLF